MAKKKPECRICGAKPHKGKCTRKQGNGCNCDEQQCGPIGRGCGCKCHWRNQCRCKLGKKRECETCLKKLQEISRLFSISVIEFLSKAKWIGEAKKLECNHCTVRYADELGEAIMKDVQGVDPEVRTQIYGVLIGFLTQQGIMHFPKTTEAYTDGRFKKGGGAVSTLDEVLSILYRRK